MRLRQISATALLLSFVAPILAADPAVRGKAEHVVVVVWDGMRPDFVTPENTPTLAALARSGVFFKNHHPAYPSSTNVNGAVLATGDYPVHNGIISNQEFRPEVDPLKQFDTADFAALDAPDGTINRNLIVVSTVAEIVQKAGYRTAVAGSKPVAQLADRARKRESEIAQKSVVVFRGKVLPRTAETAITAALGPFPKHEVFPRSEENAWTTRALTEALWKDDVPKFSLLWLSEPDLTQHETAPGSPASLAAIKSDDDNLAKVLAALQAKNALTTTDIFVVSDHGFSTVDRALDVAELLRAASFDAIRVFTGAPKPGQIMVVSLGGSVEFYVIGHDAKLTQKLVDFLQHSDFAGVILTREKHEGTFTLAQVHLESATAPDVIVSCRWSDTPNKFGVAGEVPSDIGKNVGQGTHSTFSPHDMNNTLVVSGPDFRTGWSDKLPTGNIDIAPTILRILGLEPPVPMDGRVLSEALRGSLDEPPARETNLESHCDAGGGVWRQTLRLTEVGHVTYFLEGNGGRVPKKEP